ncbi:MAG TPA: cytochrome c oxidase assembly protein [Thermomicrobiales bacterium]|nr:cytochrome c oxidase assembly protein [Thermomicrobiales bacterium]
MALPFALGFRHARPAALLVAAAAAPGAIHVARLAAPVPADIWTSWTFDPVALLLLLLAAALYARGAMRLARARRRYGLGPGVTASQVTAFGAGLLVLAVVLLSPLDRLSAALLSAHMVQYLALTEVIPLLLLLGHPAAPLGWALPAGWTRGARRRCARAREGRAVRQILGQPLLVGALDVAVLLGWHLPGVYQATVTNGALHLLQQLTFLAAALLFWWAVRYPGARREHGHGRALLCLVVTSVLSSAFGLVLYGSPGLWYAIYQGRTAAWGLSALEDQQIAGLILGVAPEAFDVVVAIMVLAGWLRAEERRMDERQGNMAQP